MDVKQCVFALICALAAPGAVLAQPGEYIVGAPDILQITVFGEEALTGEYPVDRDGTFTFPLIGAVRADGLATSAIERELRTRLADGFLKDPQVHVKVHTYSSQRVFVVGQVERPGAYPLSGETSLLEALSLAGSVSATAGPEVVIVRPRQGRAPGPALPDQPDVAAVVRVDLNKLQSGALFQGARLQDGDTIFVPKAEDIYVFGQVRNPGIFPMQQGMTVLQALALAGGVTERGSTGRLRIVRMVEGERKELKVKLGDAVLPGDTVIVKERLF
jgi:polysaccharide export outer membrane protein